MNKETEEAVEKLVAIQRDIDNELNHIQLEIKRLEAEYDDKVLTKKNIETAISYLRG